jgi:hypothetical protein
MNNIKPIILDFSSVQLSPFDSTQPNRYYRPFRWSGNQQEKEA